MTQQLTLTIAERRRYERLMGELAVLLDVLRLGPHQASYVAECVKIGRHPDLDRLREMKA